MPETLGEIAVERKCLGTYCENEAGTLQCPKCLGLGMKDSFFCSQECFRKNWNQHKILHRSVAGKPQDVSRTYNPFPNYPFSGSVKPEYPLSVKRAVPKSISHPDWAEDGVPKGEQRLNQSKISILDASGQEAMRRVCRLAREVLDITAAEIRPGVTTDYLDEICHRACIERDSYPSPLNYNRFPKSLCTSPNEVVCHGIPDQRALLDGDILNLDVSLYHGGYHADVNETYYVGDQARADPDSVRLIETTRECLDIAINLVKPGTPIREFGKIIEKHAKYRACSVIANWGGHGVNTEFHAPPWIPHYAKNRAVGICKPGMAFTIEPILTVGRPREASWPDEWTNVTVDGKRAAQFGTYEKRLSFEQPNNNINVEHTLLVTETGVEILTARRNDSPGGSIPIQTQPKAA